MSEKDTPIFVLQIDEVYRVVSDKARLNWILQRYEDVMDIKTKKPSGEKQWKDLGYFGGNIGTALKRYAIEFVRDQDTLYIDELVSKLNEIDLKIDKVVKLQNIKLVGKGEE